jgi:hypothetical protein
MCLGAGLGLGATATLIEFLPALVAATAFAVVLTVGLLELRRPPRNSSLPSAGILFAFIAGMSCVEMTLFAGSPSWFSDRAVTSGMIGIFGMLVCLIGAAMSRELDPELSSATLIDRNWIGALLVCVGGVLGLVGSRSAWFFPLIGFLGVASSSLILLFGVRLFRKGPDRRLLAALTLYFALVSVADIIFFLPNSVIFLIGALWVFSVRILGAVIAVFGAIILLPHPST